MLPRFELHLVYTCDKYSVTLPPLDQESYAGAANINSMALFVDLTDGRNAVVIPTRIQQRQWAAILKQTIEYNKELGNANINVTE